MSVEITFEELFAGILGRQEPPKVYGDEPDTIRYQQAYDLFREHTERLNDARNADETAMLTPRITVRDHDDMHVLMSAMDEFMTDKVHDWQNALAIYGMGGDENTYEELAIRSRQITEAAKLRHALTRIHTSWAKEQDREEEHTETFDQD